MKPFANGHESCIQQKPALDPSSFETLLAAAWVLQRQQDRKVLASQPAGREIAATLQSWMAPQAEIEEVSSHRPHLERTLGREAPSSMESPPERLCVARVSGISRRGLDQVWRQEARLLLTAAELIRSLVESWRRHQAKIKITPISYRAVMAACLPCLILAVIVAFVLSQVSSRGHANAAGPSAVDARLKVGNAKVATGDVRSVEVGRGDASRPIALAGSHSRITDPETLAVVDELSGHEIRVLRWQAQGGDDSAALVMGMLYETGHYVPQNCYQAALWVAKSANSGNAAAEYNLGLRYREGDGVPVDEHEVEQWLQKAADQNYFQAAAVLREIAANGF